MIVNMAPQNTFRWYYRTVQAWHRIFEGGRIITAAAAPSPLRSSPPAISAPPKVKSVRVVNWHALHLATLANNLVSVNP